MIQASDQTHNIHFRVGLLILSIILVSSLLFNLSCEEPAYSFDNEADPDSMGYSPPALFFWPDSIAISKGQKDTIDVYALKIDSLAGAYIGIEYHWGSLTIDTVLFGDYFSSNTSDSLSPLIITEDNQGTLDIYVFYLPDENTFVSGTGSIAEIVFRADEKGTSILQFADSTELRKPDNIQILLNDMGEGLIHVVD
ncbi:MAG: hypothetical protein HOD97_08595 [Candidatus Marinimicrobia bacterium]|jgi:hypothetical protein|nr:hypothetical protein [Candidatus Neomarinimicrobiota bacterium]MBT3618255.1 hypothetical protein [Candidatus Neomarinimicrobiota bacterium]MBT3829581.1 hypothetical protein [Candidatus Neomarinimicrobiota bacterium]MBT3997464.1 hypothetical protein [Candidatus Neomarinimicrobiota bacterium]MBT4281654.1 hypothetical protein [Candidatus Neomarinimicrobiota bacterium]